MEILIIVGLIALLLGKFWKFIGWLAAIALGLFVILGACAMAVNP